MIVACRMQVALNKAISPKLRPTSDEQEKNRCAVHYTTRNKKNTTIH